jgi:hypothetical protein
MGLVSAPLLAGFSLTLAVLVIQADDSFHWAGCCVVLVCGRRAGIHRRRPVHVRARQYSVTPPEIEMWWKDPDESGRREMLRREQRYYRREHESWARLARRAYDIGIVGFLFAVVVVLIPRGGLGAATDARLAVVALAAAGCVAEVAWIGATSFSRRSARAWPPAPGPEMDS